MQLINIECLIIHGTHVTANNSTNDNVVSFFGQWTREEEIIYVTTYLETKSFKTVQAKFVGYLTQQSSTEKLNLSLSAQISNHRVNKQPQQSGRISIYRRKLTASFPDNVDAVRDSVGRSPKSPSDDVPKNLVFYVHSWI